MFHQFNPHSHPQLCCCSTAVASLTHYYHIPWILSSISPTTCNFVLDPSRYRHPSADPGQILPGQQISSRQPHTSPHASESQHPHSLSSHSVTGSPRRSPFSSLFPNQWITNTISSAFFLPAHPSIQASKTSMNFLRTQLNSP